VRIDRRRARDVLLVLLGVVALVLKSHWARVCGPLGFDYGGNVAASFSAFFVLKLPAVPGRLRAGNAAALALLATGLFESVLSKIIS
jgi:hypothetical protein